MDILLDEGAKTLRAAILGLVYDNQRRRFSRLGLVQLGGALEKLFYDLSLDDLITVLEDLKERGYIDFDRSKDQRTWHVQVEKIRILPAGRDLVEKTTSDPAVRFD